MRSSILIAFLFAPAALIAAPKTDSFQTSRQRPSEIEDIGEIREAGDGKTQAPPPESPVKFRANLSFRTDYTSNARLSGDHGSGDVLWLPTIDVGMNVPLGKGFTFDLAARIESVLYSHNDERSFIGYSANATLDWRPRPNLPRIYVAAEPYRYDRFDGNDLISQAIGATVGTDWGFAFNNGNSLAFMGYSFTEYYADPNIDSRASHRAVAGLAHQFRPQLIGQLFYAYQFNDFDDIDREDNRHTVGLSLIWQLRRHLFATLSGSFVDNDSTQDHASYQSAGGSLGLSLQF